MGRLLLKVGQNKSTLDDATVGKNLSTFVTQRYVISGEGGHVKFLMKLCVYSRLSLNISLWMAPRDVGKFS